MTRYSFHRACQDGLDQDGILGAFLIATWVLDWSAPTPGITDKAEHHHFPILPHLPSYHIRRLVEGHCSCFILSPEDEHSSQLFLLTYFDLHHLKQRAELFPVILS